MMLTTALPLPTITSGDDLAAVISNAAARHVLSDGSVGVWGDDVIVVARKIVAKAQGRFFALGAIPQEEMLSFNDVPAGLVLAQPVDCVAECVQIRRGLAARWGGRPAVVISGSVEAQGRDYPVAVAGMSHKDAEVYASLARGQFVEHPGHPVVIFRGANAHITWEDTPEGKVDGVTNPGTADDV